MGKKYLETKKTSLESSVLGVWKTAIEEGEAIRDAAQMTKKEDDLDEGGMKRGKDLKTFKPKPKKEEVEIDESEYDQKITFDQIEESFMLLDEQQTILGEGTFTEEQIDIIDALKEMTEEEHDELLEQMDDDQLEIYEGILGAIGRGVKKVAKRFGTSQGRASAKLKKAKKKQNVAQTKSDTVAAKAKTKEIKKSTRAAAAASGIGIRGKATKAAKAAGAGIKKGAKKAGAAIKKSTEEVDLDEAPVSDVETNIRKLPDMRDALMQVRAGKPVYLDEKQDTHVDPEDREELDKEVDGEGGAETAKKMKKSKEPAPNISEASGDKEAYKKFFDAALKKFKVTSPAELEGDDKKKFFDYIDKNWEGDNEKAEAAMSQVREFKIQSMKAALAQVWGMEEGKNPFKKEDDEKEMKKKVKTETGKKAAVIDINPKIAD